MTGSTQTWTKALGNPCSIAAVLLIVPLFSTNVYRAATQSISHDEGVMYQWFLSGTWGQVLDFEHGNHHVISDLLCKAAIQLFGLSAFAMRIPALLGGLLYFVSVFLLSALLFGEGLLFLMAVALLSLNPLVLDYLLCARGYGPALGLFFFALYYAACWIVEPESWGAADTRRDLLRGGVALGLSLGCNAIMIFPGAALAASLVALAFGDALLIRTDQEPVAAAVSQKPRNPKKKRKHGDAAGGFDRVRAEAWKQTLLLFVLPAVALSGFFLMLPRQLLDMEEGYWGPASVLAILDGLVRNSLVHSPWGLAGWVSWIPAETAVRFATLFGVPLLMAGSLAAGVFILASWIQKRSVVLLSPLDRFLLVLSAMLPATLLMVVISRYVFAKPYPELRTAMYWIPLMGLTGLCLVRWLGQTAGIARNLSQLLAGVLLLVTVQFATQFNTRYFAEWLYCAPGRDMMEIIRAKHVGSARVRVGESWQLEPVINFYRVAWDLEWMEPVIRASPEGVYDYYMLMGDDRALVDRLHLNTLMKDRLSGVVLATGINSR